MPITIKEARAMRGVEFTYYLNRQSDSVLALVKEFDPKIGLTCVSLSLKTKHGGELPDTEGDGTCCLIGYNFKRRDSLTQALEDLSIINRVEAFHGNFKQKNINCIVSCAF